MKSRSSINMVSVFCLLALAFAGCSKKNSQTAAEQNTNILASGTWNISSVMVDNTDQSSMYTGMTLDFTSGAYTTTNGKVVWPASGSWSFASSDGKVINRGDGIDVTVSQITDSKLVLELDWAKSTFGGRVSSGGSASGGQHISSIGGHHVFTFVK
jgi:hypothetical protein